MYEEKLRKIRDRLVDMLANDGKAKNLNEFVSWILIEVLPFLLQLQLKNQRKEYELTSEEALIIIESTKMISKLRGIVQIAVLQSEMVKERKPNDIN